MFFVLLPSTGGLRCKLLYVDDDELQSSLSKFISLVSLCRDVRDNPYGNFGNQRMEMLDVAMALRFHVPVVLLVLANFRGLDSWDSETLGPLVKDLMNYEVGMNIQESSRGLIDRLEDATYKVCGGVMSRVRWKSSICWSIALFDQPDEFIKCRSCPLCRWAHSGIGSSR